MNKQIKRFIALGLTMSLASVPTLSEVSKSKEISEIQEESFSLLSTDIDNILLSMEADRLSSEEFALLTLQQPVIVKQLPTIKKLKNADHFLLIFAPSHSPQK